MRALDGAVVFKNIYVSRIKKKRKKKVHKKQIMKFLNNKNRKVFKLK